MAEIFGNWITEADAAAEAGESLRTWQRRRQARTGPAFVKAGARVLYRRQAIIDWLQAQEVQPVRATAASGEAA